ncbi:MAG: hypothetical protein QOG05_1483 [Streptosporangiaceae bacterium]|jgi:hypothetical protein|nr:hypothetical protein [Streptosporangiaceae bacterium]
MLGFPGVGCLARGLQALADAAGHVTWDSSLTWPINVVK